MAWPERLLLLLSACLVALQSALVLANGNPSELHLIQATSNPQLLTDNVKMAFGQLFAKQANRDAFKVRDTSGACLRKSVASGILDLWLTTIVTPMDISSSVQQKGRSSSIPPGLPVGVLVIDCAMACHLTPGFYGAFGVRSVALACASEQFNDKGAYPNLTRIMAPFSSLSEPILQFMNHFRWKSLVIVSTTKGNLVLSAKTIEAYLKTRSIRVYSYTIGNQEELTEESREVNIEIRETLKLIQDSDKRILLLLMDIEDRMRFLHAASKMKMLNEKYAILAIDDLAEKYKTESPKVVEDLQRGLILMNPWEETISHSRLPVTVPNIGYVFDGVLLLFRILALLSNTNRHSRRSTNQKRETTTHDDITSTIRFNGLSGFVSFESDGTRRMPYSFSNVRDGKKVEVMVTSFSNDSSSTGPTTNFTAASDSMIWPDGTKVTPSDTSVVMSPWWKSNQTYVFIGIGAVLFTAIVLCALYFVNRYMKYRYMLITTQGWIIPWTDLEIQTMSVKKSVHSESMMSHNELTIDDSSQSIRIDFSSTDDGTLFEATYQSTTVLVQMLNCQHIDLKDELILKEIHQTMNLRHENLVRYIGLCPYQPNAIVMSIAKRGSLRDILRSGDSRLLTLDFMASLLRDAARGMEYLHSTEIGSHGCLTSERCVIDSRWTCQIAGCGFRLLKKCRPRNRNKDQLEEEDYREMLWMAPELLRLPDKMRPIYGTKEGDIYSYSIILQEVVYGGEPFPEEAKSYFYKEIVMQIKRKTPVAFRPLLNGAQCSQDWISLIERCWSEAPSKRPTFRKIVQDLDNMSETQDNAGIIENLVVRTEKYALNLADLVQQATSELDFEKQKGYNLLYSLLPRYVASKLEEGESSAAEEFESATMCFADIVGFTKIAAASAPMQVIELLSSLYSAYDEITSTHDTYKIETIGDCYVVVSGLPIRNGDQHAVEIANLALDLLTFVKSFTIPHLSQTQLQIRIGMHSGPALAGIVGQKTPRYAVFGVTAAVAESLEASAEPNTIHTTQTTVDILNKTGQQYEVEQRGEREVIRGMTLTTYFLLGCTRKPLKVPRRVTVKDLPRKSRQSKTKTTGKRSRTSVKRKSSAKKASVDGESPEASTSAVPSSKETSKKRKSSAKKSKDSAKKRKWLVRKSSKKVDVDPSVVKESTDPTTKDTTKKRKWSLKKLRESVKPPGIKESTDPATKITTKKQKLSVKKLRESVESSGMKESTDPTTKDTTKKPKLSIKTLRESVKPPGIKESTDPATKDTTKKPKLSIKTLRESVKAPGIKESTDPATKDTTKKRKSSAKRPSKSVALRKSTDPANEGASNKETE